MLELYHHGSSVCAAKVRFALTEKRIDWTGRYVDILAGEQFKPDFLAINPKAVVRFRRDISLIAKRIPDRQANNRARPLTSPVQPSPISATLSTPPRMAFRHG